MTFRIHPLALAIIVAAAWGCSSESRAPSGGATFDSGANGTDANVPTDGATPIDSGTDPTDASTDSSDAAATDADVTDAPGAAECPHGFPELTPVPVGYPQHAEGERLAAITWDELTMAWTTKSGGTVTVHYADRDSRDASFTTSWTLPSSLGPFPEEKVALSADGLTMLVLSGDRRTIRQISRSARGAPFDESTVTTEPFERLTTSGEGGSAKQLADLVLSKDGQTLFYTDLLRTEGSTIRMSLRLSDGTWDAPNAIDAPQLAIESGLRRRPTGLSAEGNALFYYDEEAGYTKVAFRTPGSATFTEFVAFSVNGQRAMPTDGCARVYLDLGDAPPKDEDAGSSPPLVRRIFRAP